MDIIVYQVEARDAENAGVLLVSLLTYKTSITLLRVIPTMTFQSFDLMP